MEDLLKMKDELVDDAFEDVEVCQDDEPKIVTKILRTFSFHK